MWFFIFYCWISFYFALRIMSVTVILYTFELVIQVNGFCCPGVHKGMAPGVQYTINFVVDGMIFILFLSGSSDILRDWYLTHFEFENIRPYYTPLWGVGGHWVSPRGKMWFFMFICWTSFYFSFMIVCNLTLLCWNEWNLFPRGTQRGDLVGTMSWFRCYIHDG